MMKPWIVCLLMPIFWLGIAQADQVTEENRLLKSWGLKFNTRGLLKFRGDNQPSTEYRPWQPEFSVYLLNKNTASDQDMMPPLVISSKQKTEN